jgi:hypothetical protein
VLVGVTPILKLKVPLPSFVAFHKDDEDDVKFLVRVESDARVIMGSYTHLEHDTCTAGLHNKGYLNLVLELMGVSYGPRLVPGFDAFTEASKKRKTDLLGKLRQNNRRLPREERQRLGRPPRHGERTT